MPAGSTRHPPLSTSSSRRASWKWRISSSLPSSRKTPSEPFGRPELAAGGPGLGEALTGALGDQVALDLGEQREQRGHDLGLDVTLALDADVLLQRHKRRCRPWRARRGWRRSDPASEPGEFADDHRGRQAFAAAVNLIVNWALRDPHRSRGSIPRSGRRRPERLRGAVTRRGPRDRRAAGRLAGRRRGLPRGGRRGRPRRGSGRGPAATGGAGRRVNLTLESHDDHEAQRGPECAYATH